DLPLGVGAALAEGGQGVEVLLSSARVTGCKILAKLGEVGLLLLLVGLYLLVDGGCAAGYAGSGLRAAKIDDGGVCRCDCRCDWRRDWPDRGRGRTALAAAERGKRCLRPRQVARLQGFP